MHIAEDAAVMFALRCLHLKVFHKNGSDSDMQDSVLFQCLLAHECHNIFRNFEAIVLDLNLTSSPKHKITENVLKECCFSAR